MCELHLLNDPEHRRRRAVDVRIHRQEVDDADVRRVLLEIALKYDQLAELIEEGPVIAVTVIGVNPLMDPADRLMSC